MDDFSRPAPFYAARLEKSQGFRPSVVSDTYLSEVKSAEQIGGR